MKRVQQKQQESMGKVQQIADSVAEQKRALEAQQEVFEVSIRSYARMYIYSTYVLYCIMLHCMYVHYIKRCMQIRMFVHIFALHICTYLFGFSSVVCVYICTYMCIHICSVYACVLVYVHMFAAMIPSCSVCTYVLCM